MQNIELLRYPVGRFAPQEHYSPADIQSNMKVIEAFPEELKSIAVKLTAEQLDTAYRPEGWTARQVIHHAADSHINAYVRFKLALTENIPTIKPYDEKAWALLPDSKGDIQVSLDILNAVHVRWLRLMNSMSEKDWSKQYYHPETSTTIRLDWALHLYTWHCRHHLAHVKICAGLS